MKNPAENAKIVKIEELTPYARNSRTHSPEQVAQIAASIKEWGFTTPILIDETGSIIAGHGRLLAAQKLGMQEVPVIIADGWTDAQKRAYVIADNKLAMNAGWDDEMLRLEFAELEGLGFDLELTGFGLDEIDSINNPEASEEYTRKIETPCYEPKGKKPDVQALFDRAKTAELCKKIRSEKDLPEDVSEFLLLAAERHTVFDFAKIAEFYAHSSENIQELFEQSALVIVDFEKAIEAGFVKLSKHLAQLSQVEKHAQ